MLKWLISKTRQIVGAIKEMATFWASIGVMLVPIGVAVLIAFPNSKIIAFGLMTVGVVLSVIGYRRTLREESNRSAEATKNIAVMEGIINQLKKDEEKHSIEHERYLYLLGELGERFGISTSKTRLHFLVKDSTRRSKKEWERWLKENDFL